MPLFRDLLGSGAQWGCDFSYVEQPKPEGIAQAFLLTKDFLAGSPACLILGDNIFFGHGMEGQLHRAMQNRQGATVFAYHVRDPHRYGVVEFDAERRVLGIEEKPAKPKSNYAVTGLYFYEPGVAEKAAGLKPSARNELEITDLNNIYLQEGRLSVELLGRGIAWLDTGTHDSLLAASTFVQAVETRQGLKVACPEEIAWRKGFISREDMIKLAEPLAKTGYGQYLLALADERP